MAKTSVVLLAATIATAIALLTVMFVYSFRARERYFEARDLRAVGVLAEQLQGRIEGLESAAKNLDADVENRLPLIPNVESVAMNDAPESIKHCLDSQRRCLDVAAFALRQTADGSPGSPENLGQGSDLGRL